MTSAFGFHGKAIAVMQPYFFPYAGYFRLLAAAGTFVIFDCVQFPRRGWVHRCHVPGPQGDIEWLTLPLARQARDIRIRDLEFAADARAELDRRLARLPWTSDARTPAAAEIRDFLHAPLGPVIDFLEGGIRLVARILDLNPAIIRSSSLSIDPALRSENRVIAILKAVGAARYVNAPGGRGLYGSTAFGSAGVELNFLPPYTGPYRTMLFDLMTGDPQSIARDVRLIL
jgi:hypothetical protein